MKRILNFALAAILASFGLVLVAHAQVVNPTYLRKTGSNIYGYPNTTSTILGTSTEPGAFSNLTISGTCTGCGLSSSTGASLSANNTFTGANTFTSTTTVGNIVATGSAAIGTSINPNRTLEVNGTALFDNNVYGTNFCASGSCTFSELTLGSTGATINGTTTLNARVGIGTSTPIAQLSFGTGTTSSTGINFGGDTNLYRNSISSLITDGNFTAGNIYGSNFNDKISSSNSQIMMGGAGKTITFNASNTTMMVIGTNGTTINGTTTVSSLNSVVYFPSPSALAAGATCGVTTNVTEVGNCANDIYASAPGSNATPSTVKINFGSYNYASSTWTNPMVFATAGKYPLLVGVPMGTVLNYGGTGWAITITPNSSTQHQNGYGVTGLQLTGYSTSTNAVFLGGNAGAEGVMLDNSFISGFGTPWQIASNTWNVNINGNIFDLNGNEGIYNGATPGQTNSGERLNFVGNTFADTLGLTPAQCLTITQSESTNFTGNNWDDCQLYLGPGDLAVSISGGNAENPQTASNPNYPAYDFIAIATSTKTNVTITGFNITQDATSTSSTPPEAISNGAFLSANGVYVFGNGANAMTTFITPTGTASVALLQNINQGIGATSGFSNLLPGLPAAYVTGRPMVEYASSTTSANLDQLIFWNGTSGGIIGEANNGGSGFTVGSISSNAMTFKTGDSIRGTISSAGFWDLGGTTNSTTTVSVQGSFGLTNASFAGGGTNTLTSGAAPYQIFTGASGAGTDTLPLISTSQSQWFNFVSKATSNLLHLSTGTSTDNICLGTGTSTSINLNAGSSTVFYNDGSCWDVAVKPN